MIIRRVPYLYRSLALVLVIGSAILLHTANSADKNATMNMQSHGMAGHTESGTDASLPAISESTNGLFSCPMHPEVTSHEPGKCPKCGMFLTLKMMKHAQPGAGMRMGMGMDHSAHMKVSADQPAGQHSEHDGMQDQTPAVMPFWEQPQSASTTEHTVAGQNHSAMPMNMPRLQQQDGGSLPMIETAQEHARKHQDPNYVCSMHPQIISNKPGSCPICGMDLVARADMAKSAGTDYPQVFLTPSVIQNMGVRVTRAESRMLTATVKTQGQVAADEDRIKTVHSRTAGWIENIYGATEGDRIERKDTMVDFFSPWINEVQLSYIEALEEYDMLSFDPSRSNEVNAKLNSLQTSLRDLSMTPMEIMRVRNDRKVLNTIKMMAPQGGILTELNIREGAYVEPYQPMYTVIDLKNIWVMVDIYEHQASKVRKGQTVRITTEAIPSRVWEGKVDFIYPEVDPVTRTLRARISIRNPDEALLLNMYVEVEILPSNHQRKVLSVPREAVITTGKREVVVKSMGNGHFLPVNVVTGQRDDSYVQIVSGLEQGDEVVVSGQFLIDSESSLQASFLRMAK